MEPIYTTISAKALCLPLAINKSILALISSEIFDASSTIQIVTNNEASKILNINGSNTESVLAGDVELMRSNVFLNRALSKLPLSISYFFKGTFKVNEHYKMSEYSADIKVVNEDIYYVPIYIKFLNSKNYSLNYSIKGKKVSKVYRYNTWGDFGDFQLKLNPQNINSLMSASKGLGSKDGYFFKINDPANLAKDYVKKIDIIILNIAAGTIQISFQDNSPQKSADVVNVIAEEFKYYDVEKKSESSKKILEFIDLQLSKVYETLKDYESQIQNLKKELRATNIPDYSKIYVDKLNEFETQLADIKLQSSILREV